MKQKLVYIIFFAIFLSGCSLPFFYQKKYAALQITTNPKADVFLNDEKVGETPFTSEKLKSQEYTVRLVPKDNNLFEWQTTITLNPNVTTVINYDFGKDRQESSGIILTLELLPDKEAVEVAIVSIPDNAAVKLDEQPKGFTPLQIKNVSAGVHSLSVSAPGYKQRQLDTKTVAGHKLTVDVQLAKEPLLAEEASPSAQIFEQEEKEESTPGAKITKPTGSITASPSAQIRPPYVEILETPTGWLRVRSSPNTFEDNEIAKVNPGEKYTYLESNDTGWHKIMLDETTQGWISGRYARVVK